jgi:hypothetical protein
LTNGTRESPKIGCFGQTFLPFAGADGRNVWPLLQESLAAFASKKDEFFSENTMKLQESLAVMS